MAGEGGTIRNKIKLIFKQVDNFVGNGFSNRRNDENGKNFLKTNEANETS